MGNRLFVFMFFFLIGCSNMRVPSSLSDFNGNWNVIDVKSLSIGSISESASDYEERIHKRNECVGDLVIVSNDSIYSTDRKCAFFPCAAKSTKLLRVNVVNSLDVDELSDDRRISRDLVKYLITGEDSVRSWFYVFYTDCPTAYGDNGLKIIVLNRSRIVLYVYYNAYFLEKNS